VDYVKNDTMFSNRRRGNVIGNRISGCKRYRSIIKRRNDSRMKRPAGRETNMCNDPSAGPSVSTTRWMPEISMRPIPIVFFIWYYRKMKKLKSFPELSMWS